MSTVNMFLPESPRRVLSRKSLMKSEIWLISEKCDTVWFCTTYWQQTRQYYYFARECETLSAELNPLLGPLPILRVTDEWVCSIGGMMIDRGKPRHLSQCHFLCHKFQMDRPGNWQLTTWIIALSLKSRVINKQPWHITQLLLLC